MMRQKRTAIDPTQLRLKIHPVHKLIEPVITGLYRYIYFIAPVLSGQIQFLTHTVVGRIIRQHHPDLFPAVGSPQEQQIYCIFSRLQCLLRKIEPSQCFLTVYLISRLSALDFAKQCLRTRQAAASYKTFQLRFIAFRKFSLLRHTVYKIDFPIQPVSPFVK